VSISGRPRRGSEAVRDLGQSQAVAAHEALAPLEARGDDVVQFVKRARVGFVNAAGVDAKRLQSRGKVAPQRLEAAHIARDQGAPGAAVLTRQLANQVLLDDMRPVDFAQAVKNDRLRPFQ
jgi:hypothetical protein